jgi:hypothetical protein
MYKDFAFQLVRSGETVLWAGAGLSLYAGYLSAYDLAKTIYDELSEPEKQFISSTLSLPELAEEYERARGRNSLLSLLKKAMIIPRNIEVHEKIASIPHFRTIITTNYDPLFELAYGNRCEKITHEQEVPYIDEKKVQVLKIHGDLSNRNSLILTKSDYLNFFKQDSYNLLWNLVKERIATKNIILVGYSFEDPNTTVIFEKVFEALGCHRKEVFFVAPTEKMSPYKLQDLNKRGIKVINSSGEAFIDDLLKDIETNIHKDFKNGWISADIYREFLSYYNQAPKLRSRQGGFMLDSIEAIDGELKSDFNFTIKQDDKLAQEIDDFMSGKKFGEVTIPDDVLVSSDIKVGGLPAPHTEDGIASWIFRSSPAKEFFFDICGPDGFELHDLKGEIFKSPLAGEIHIHYKNLKVKVRAEFDGQTNGQLRYHFVLSEPYARTSDGIQLFTLMHLLHKGEKFTAYTKDGHAINSSWIPDGKKYPDASSYLSYFKNLSQIEKHYGIRFQNIKGLTSEAFQLVNRIVKVIAGEPIDELGLLRADISELTQEGIENIKSNLESASNFHMRVEPMEEVELHDHSIKLGYRTVEISNPYLANYEKLIAGTETTIAIASRSNQIRSTFSDTLDHTEII